MYKILHIPTGLYHDLFDGPNGCYDTVEEAKNMLNSWFYPASHSINLVESNKGFWFTSTDASHTRPLIWEKAMLNQLEIVEVPDV